MGTEIGNTITVAPGQSFTITLDTADPVASPNVTITKNEVVTDDITHSSTEDVHEKSFTFHTKSTADGSYVIKITNSNTDYITNVLVHLDESEMNAINPQLSEQEINDNRMKADAAKLAAGIEAAKSRTEADLNTYYDAWAYTTVNGKKILVTQKNGTLSILYQGKQLAAIALPENCVPVDFNTEKK